ncbi:MAG TPA: magnesium transporter [Spirochaetota bacterium]|nr:magnesium transporter [Spirochaetota bacterium]HOL57964.1 magnesium transporter [Spirochaetota bacterium]HPP05490.1 magnesium transporter [Spirochaetota bacterium]
MSEKPVNFAELLKDRRLKKLKEEIKFYKAPDIAKFIEQYLDYDSDLIIFFNLIPAEIISDVFSELDIETQHFILTEISNEKIKDIISNLESDDRVALFDELPENLVNRLLNLLPKSKKSNTIKLLSYSKNSIGRAMTTDFISIRENWSVAKSLNYIRRKSSEIKNVDIIFVTDNQGILLDSLDLEKFIFEEPNTIVKKILDYSFIKLSPYDKKEKGIELINKYNVVAIPVTDNKNRLLGIVTFDDIMDIEQEEVSRIFYKKSAITPLEKDYLSTNVFYIFIKRVPWLIALVFVNLFSGGIISIYEDVIQKMVALVFFLPLLIASAGNSGAQSSTLVIRAMATNEIELKDILKVIIKDFLVSLLLGIVMGLAVSILGFIRGGIKIAFIVGISMFSVVVFGSILGTLLPFLFSFVRIDPANGSSPLVTTLADIFGVFLYFIIATTILKF